MARINAREIGMRLISAIDENKAWLSEIDGAIGDGDHGVNMAKGFGMAKEKLEEVPDTLSDVLRTIGMTLVSNIGGAMGPIYGTFFMGMGKSIREKDTLSGEDICGMLKEALDGVRKRGKAEVGDKTLVDTLDSALRECEKAAGEGRSRDEVITAMMEGAKRGMESTKDLVAKKGRSSRLGERSRGTIDAGSASCYIILKTLGESLKENG